MLTREQIFLGYRLLLHRNPENEQVIEEHCRHDNLSAFLNCLMTSEEYINPIPRPPLPPLIAEIELGESDRPISIANYLAPLELRPHSDQAVRALLIGQCIFDTWPEIISSRNPRCEVERILFSNLSPINQPGHDLNHYDFQIVQIPLRSLIPESEYMRLNYNDISGHARVLYKATDRIDLFMNELLKFSNKLPTFVLSYMTPQQNYLGRLLPRYDIRNPIHLYEKINEALYKSIEAHQNCHLLDIDRISGVFGRRFSQDDSISIGNHGGLASDFDYLIDQDRLIPDVRPSEHYHFDTGSFIELVWNEALAMWETLRGENSVKMVCVDLDDTLWRGALAERQTFGAEIIEGWPLGVAEALSYLKRRGIILAIISKNDEINIRDLWGHTLGNRFTLDDFAIRKINWNSKADNISEALVEANILPSSAIFLDDNPAEREEVKKAHPQLRVIDSSHYLWRRILLWSAETQVATITAESARRTEMIQALASRENARSNHSREDFLRSLEVEIKMVHVRDRSNVFYERTFELINKTNQFNTNGKRWSKSEYLEFPVSGGEIWAFEVNDKFTRYGIAGVVLVRNGLIEQFVMSCRVFGLEVEVAALSALFAKYSAGGEMRGTISETMSNRPCRDLFARCGWVRLDEQWIGSSAPPLPAHISMAFAPDGAAVMA